MRALVWFRSDLRADDNTALSAACSTADRGVAGIFLVCPQQWRKHDWADIKVEFLLRNLACLAERLKRLRIPLLVREAARFVDAPDILLEVAGRLRCDALYFNREYETNEQRRDAAVTKAFGQEGISVRSFDDQTIVPPDVPRASTGRFYTMFTPFKRSWIACAREREARPVPEPHPLPGWVCAPDSIPESLAGFDLSKGRPEEWPAGERYAAARLSDFIDRRLSSYGRLRDFPGSDATSRLSPYLAIGVISPRRCLLEAREANRGRLNSGRAGPTTWISELVWREFYRHVLVGFPRVGMNRAFKPAAERLPWRYDEELFRAWCEGRTGYPIIDAGMRQLSRTGWMHNRLRMITAMFLSKDLFIDWRWGERHFMRHLVDGDLASNNGGWQWSASTGTDAVPYFRVFNPWRQSKKFDPEAEFIRRWVPELRGVDPRVLHNPTLLARERRAGLAYAQPVCDHAAARRSAIRAFRNSRAMEKRHD